MKNAFIKNIYQEKILPQSINAFRNFSYVINEGGAGGHMAHPFDLPEVKTGDDLIQLFKRTATALKMKPAPVKIDGVNISFKYLKDIKQFALDRGSMKPLDVQGITIDKLQERFGEGHGFLTIGKTVLEILNRAIPVVQTDIEKLGLLDPTVFVNAEYVEGQTNVLGYKDNFLALHNIGKFVQVTPKRREGTLVPFDKQALKDFASKLDKIAEPYKFRVYQEFEAKIIKEPDFTSVLNEKIDINIDGKTHDIKTLGDWLKQIKKPTTPVTVLGKRVIPITKDVYIKLILENQPLTSLSQNVEDYDEIIAGAIIYHATRLLGRKLLEAMESDIGPANEQEGIVLTNLASKTFKITGDFIIKGMESQFKK